MIYIITASISECVSQYHQDWNELAWKVIGVFTDEEEFNKAWVQRPKSWHELHPYDGQHFSHYATEGDISVEWDFEEMFPNKLFTGDIRD